MRAAGSGSALVARVRAAATVAAVTSVPSWKLASRSVNSQVRSSSRVQDSASAGAAEPLASRAVSPSVTPRRLRRVASAPYGERFSVGGKARATRSREPDPASDDESLSSSPPEAKQPVSSGESNSPTSSRRRRGVRMVLGSVRGMGWGWDGVARMRAAQKREPI